MKDLNWKKIEKDLKEKGFAVIPKALNKKECQSLIDDYFHDHKNYYHKDMREWGMDAEYKYFGEGDIESPESLKVPDLVSHFKAALYNGLRDLANEWVTSFNGKGFLDKYPKDYRRYLNIAAENGLKHPFTGCVAYRDGAFNTLHSDQNEEPAGFPFQMTVLLNDENEFSGGRFILQEEGAAPIHLVLKRGDAVIFPSDFRVVQKGKKKSIKKMQHGAEIMHSQTDKEFCRIIIGIGCHNRHHTPS